jgi:hypothetical protein
MDEYKSVQNISILSMASRKMLKDRFNITMSEDAINHLIHTTMSEVDAEYSKVASLTVKELNNISLCKIKLQASQRDQHRDPPRDPPSDTSQPANESDIINAKLRELELQRKLVQTASRIDTHPDMMKHPDMISHDPYISLLSTHNDQITLPATQPIIYNATVNEHTYYKTFIINSINRDWIKYPQRNSLKCTVPIDMKMHKCFPDTLCMPSYVKKQTPYILMHISDGVKNIFYTFVPCSVSLDMHTFWDQWKTVDHADHIYLENKHWHIKLFDFMNKELDLGSDDIQILEVSHIDTGFKMKLDHIEHTKMHLHDMIFIKTCNHKIHHKKIIGLDSDMCSVMINNDDNDINIDDFIHAKILNTTCQYSLIVKYHIN